MIKGFFRVYVEFFYGGHEVVLFSRAIDVFVVRGKEEVDSGGT